MVGFPKSKRAVDKNYTDNIHKHLLCIVVGCCGESWAHHITAYGFGGMGMKPDDYMTMPLCVFHHAEVHADFKNFEKYNRSQKFYIQRTLGLTLERGWIGKNIYNKYMKITNKIQVKK